MIVQKYGGSSVGTPVKIRKVAERIAQVRGSGTEVVVVVSAMGDTTDELISLAKEVTDRPPYVHEREMDMLLSAGERISMALLSMALREAGQEAISFTGSQAGIVTNESHTRARILEIRPLRVREELARGRVVIVAGFQGVSRTKEVTTLGRGGSDTTAVALARALGAERCEVYTDVPGIFSADPRIVSAATRYERLPLDLVLEMAAQGAQVMHPRSIEIAREGRFGLFVGNAHGETHGENGGTHLVPDDTGLELPKVVAVTSKRGLRALHFSGRQATEVLDQLGQGHTLSGTDRDFMAQDFQWNCQNGLNLLVDPAESSAFLEKFAAHADPGTYATVSLIGFQLQHNATMAARVYGVLAEKGISLVGLTTHPQSFTVWLSDSEGLVERAVCALHEAFIETKRGSS